MHPSGRRTAATGSLRYRSRTIPREFRDRRSARPLTQAGGIGVGDPRGTAHGAGARGRSRAPAATRAPAAPECGGAADGPRTRPSGTGRGRTRRRASRSTGRRRGSARSGPGTWPRAPGRGRGARPPPVPRRPAPAPGGRGPGSADARATGSGRPLVSAGHRMPRTAPRVRRRQGRAGGIGFQPDTGPRGRITWPVSYGEPGVQGLWRRLDNGPARWPVWAAQIR